jgi:hypothetical protein
MGTRLLRRVALKPALKRSLRLAKGWSDDDVDDESLKDFCSKCATEAQAKLIANAVTYDDWSRYLADKTPSGIPAASEDLVELVEQEKVRRKNLELQAASSRPEPKEPAFDRAAYLERRTPSDELSSQLLAANLVFAHLAATDQRALIEADADYVGARGAQKAAAKTALRDKVQAVRREREHQAELQAQAEDRRRTADLATERMRATPAGDPLGNDLVARIWQKAVDSYVSMNPNVTLDDEFEPETIGPAVENWRRVRNRCSRLGVRDLHVPGGAVYIQDKGPKDIQRGSRRREARSFQADFISIWSGFIVNVHVDATGPVAAS